MKHVRRIRIFIFIALSIAVFLTAKIWLNLFEKPVERGILHLLEPKAENTSETKPVAYEVKEFVSGLNVPWSIVFTSESRMLVSERPGRIRIVENGALQPKPLASFPEVSVGGEEGLMSLAVDPDYEDNQHVYAALAYESGSKMLVKIVRFKDNGTTISDSTTILDNIPATQFHAGCRIKFGPDGNLYITTGDATDKDLPQDINSLAGKVLRITKNGTIPNGNPFPNNAVWSYGHRNPQGIAWNQENGELYMSEHGPSVFDGPAGGDEVNRIVKGGNYGWPLVSHEKQLAGTIQPMIVYTPAEAPGSLMSYSGKLFPQFKNNLFFGALKGEGLMRITIDPRKSDKITSYEKLAEVRFGRIRDVTEGPDGSIYFSTSNRDGRGNPAKTDDRIFRIVPKK